MLTQAPPTPALLTPALLFGGVLGYGLVFASRSAS